MAQSFVGWASVGDVTGIPCSRSSAERRHRKGSHGGRTIEVESRMQVARTGEPLGTERNLVVPSIHHGKIIGEGGLHMIMHVLRRSTGNQVKDMVVRVRRIDLNASLLVPENAPAFATCFERTVLQ